MVSTRLAITLAVIMVVLALSVNAAFRKPPFNGSIFGKRSNTVTGKCRIDETTFRLALMRSCDRTLIVSYILYR